MVKRSMTRIKDDAYYLEKMIADIDFILVHMVNISKEDLTDSRY